MDVQPADQTFLFNSAFVYALRLAKAMRARAAIAIINAGASLFLAFPLSSGVVLFSVVVVVDRLTTFSGSVTLR